MEFSYENGFIGGLLCSAEEVLNAPGGRTLQGCFKERANESIYHAALTLEANGIPVTPATIAEQTGIDSNTLVSLIETAPVAANIPLYALKVKDLATLANLQAEALSLTSAAVTSTEELLQGIENLRQKAAESVSITNGATSSADAAQLLNKWRKELGTGKHITNTGLKSLNAAFGGGFMAGCVYVVGARPGIGKTTFALNIAEKVANMKKPVLYISAEMSIEQITAKRIALYGKISSSAILKRQDLNETEKAKIEIGFRNILPKPFFISETALTVSDIAQTAASIPGLGLLVIDYLGLLHFGETENRYEAMTNISRDLKILAKRMNLPILLLAQLNRESQKRTSNSATPRLSDLRDSGAIEQDADSVILLHRRMEELTAENDFSEELEAIIAKNRFGPVGTIKYNIYPKTGIITEGRPKQ